MHSSNKNRKKFHSVNSYQNALFRNSKYFADLSRIFLRTRYLRLYTRTVICILCFLSYTPLFNMDYLLINKSTFQPENNSLVTNKLVEIVSSHQNIMFYVCRVFHFFRPRLHSEDNIFALDRVRVLILNGQNVSVVNCLQQQHNTTED